jgi:hypothetical protein
MSFIVEFKFNIAVLFRININFTRDALVLKWKIDWLCEAGYERDVSDEMTSDREWREKTCCDPKWDGKDEQEALVLNWIP